MHEELQVGYHLSKPSSLFMHISITSYHVLKLFFLLNLLKLKTKTKNSIPVSPHLYTPRHHTTGNHYPVLSMYELAFIFLFLDSIYKKDHMVFVFLSELLN